jgi:hypothetical protein
MSLAKYYYGEYDERDTMWEIRNKYLLVGKLNGKTPIGSGRKL